MYAMELYISGDDEDFLEAEEFFAASVMDPERSADEMKEAAWRGFAVRQESGRTRAL